MSSSVATKTASISKQQSMVLLKNMVRISVSSICYLRSLFPEDCYQVIQYGNSKIHQLQSANIDEKGNTVVRNNDAFLLTQWLEKGVFAALAEEYLASMIFSIYTKHPISGQDLLLETYEFKVSSGNEPPTFNDIPLRSKEDVKAQAAKFIRSLIEFANTLDPLPEERWITISLTYNTSAPPDYEPEYFRAGDESALHFTTTVTPLKISIGNIKTEHHDMSLLFVGLESLLQEDLSRIVTTQSTVLNRNGLSPSKSKDDPKCGRLPESGCNQQIFHATKEAKSVTEHPKPMSIDETSEASNKMGAKRSRIEIIPQFSKLKIDKQSDGAAQKSMVTSSTRATAIIPDLTQSPNHSESSEMPFPLNQQQWNSPSTQDIQNMNSGATDMPQYASANRILEYLTRASQTQRDKPSIRKALSLHNEVITVALDQLMNENKVVRKGRYYNVTSLPSSGIPQGIAIKPADNDSDNESTQLPSHEELRPTVKAPLGSDRTKIICSRIDDSELQSDSLSQTQSQSQSLLPSLGAGTTWPMTPAATGINRTGEQQVHEQKLSHISLSTVKNELTTLGISTATPGLVGDARYEALLRRLLDAQQSLVNTHTLLDTSSSSSSSSIVSSKKNNDVSTSSSSKGMVQSSQALLNLSISDIKARLDALGESTSTPGLVGEPRRMELMRRLTQSICGADATSDANNNDGSNSNRDGDDNGTDSENDDLNLSAKIIPKIGSNERFNDMPSALYRRDEEIKQEEKASSSEILSTMISNPVAAQDEDRIVSPDPMETIDSEEKTQDKRSSNRSFISEAEALTLKKSIKRLQNRRAVAIANQLSGPGQDPDLKAAEKMILKAEAELSRIRSQPKSSSRSTASSVLVEQGSMLPIDTLLAALERIRTDSKAMVKSIRARIRSEAEAHVEYGLAVEEAMAVAVRDSLHESGKVNRSKLSSAETTRSVIAPKAESIDEEDADGNNTVGLAPANVPLPAGPPPTMLQPAAPTLKEKSLTSQSTGALVGGKIEKEVSSNTHPNLTFQDLDDRKALTSSSSASILSSMKRDVISSTPDTTDVNGDALKPTKSSLKPKKSAKFATFDEPKAKETADTTAVLPNVDLTHVVVAPVVQPASKAAAVTEAAKAVETKSTASEPKFVDDAPIPSVAKASAQSGLSQVQALSKSYQQNSDDDDESGESSDEDSDSDGERKVQSERRTASDSKQASANSVRRHGSKSLDSDDDEDERVAKESLKKAFELPPSLPLAKPKPPPPMNSNPSTGPIPLTSASLTTTTASSKLQTVAGSELARAQHLLQGGRVVPPPSSIESTKVPTHQITETQNIAENKSVASMPAEQIQSKAENSEVGGQFLADYVWPINEKLRMPPSGDSASLGTAPASKIAASPVNPPENTNVTDDEDVPVDPSVQRIRSKQQLLRKHQPTIDSALDKEEEKFESEMFGNADDESETDDSEAGDKSDEDVERENARQLRSLRRHVKVLVDSGDLKNAEALLERCLELDPLDVKTLRSFAVFLHRKKGELARAEAFFRRAVQVCLPDFQILSHLSAKSVDHEAKEVDEVHSPSSARDKTISNAAGAGKAAAVSLLSSPPSNAGSALKLQSLLLLLLNFARFMSRSRGDVEAAACLYRKAAEIAPANASVLACVAHFLAEESIDEQEAASLFARSMKANPTCSQHALWYAKLLRKIKKPAQAEVMYRVAVQHATHTPSVEATAFCNYATFLFKYKKDYETAQTLFMYGLRKNPKHRGLIKNYSAMLKSNQQLVDIDGLLKSCTANRKDKRTQSSRGAIDRNA